MMPGGASKALSEVIKRRNVMAQDLLPPAYVNTVDSANPGGKGGWEAGKQLLFVVFKWRKLIFWLCLLFPGGVTLGLILQPTVIRANGSIMIKSDRIPLQMTGVNPASNNRWTYSAQVMQSEVRFLESRRVMEPVAKKLLAMPASQKQPEGIRAWLAAQFRAVRDFLGVAPEPKTEAEKIDEMVTRLKNQTMAVPLTDTNIIRLSHFAPTAEVAVRNLELILEHYLDEQAIAQTGADSLPKYFEQEKRRVEAQLAKAEQTLETWQAQNHAVSIDEQITNGLKLLSHRQTALKEAEEQLEATAAKVAVLKSQLNTIPKRVVVMQERVQNPVVAKLQERLVLAEVTRQDLLQRYTENSRQVQDVNSQITLLRKELNEALKQDTLGRETTEINPLYATLERELAVSQALTDSLSAQRDALRKQVHETSQSLPVLRQNKSEWGRLSRAVDLYKESYVLYAKKLEEARMATGQNREQLAQALIIARPTAAPPKSITDDFALILSASLIGLALGVAISFGIEMLNNSMRTRSDVEHYLGLPMLATIPELPLQKLLPPPTR
jgi:uncharacterized protein involved in exopolysaccharide biosynthesis